MNININGLDYEYDPEEFQNYEDFIEKCKIETLNSFIPNLSKLNEQKHELLHLIDDGNDKKIDDWLIKTNEDYYINDLLIDIKKELLANISSINLILLSELIKNIDNLKNNKSKNSKNDESKNLIRVCKKCDD